MILVAGAVVLMTLVMQGVSLPWLVRRLGLKPPDLRSEENRIRLRAARAALAWLDNHRDGDDSDDAAKSVRAFYEARTRRLQSTGTKEQKLAVAEEIDEYIALRLTLLRVERSEVLDQRRDRRFNATLSRTIERDLDLEESRLGDF